MILGWPFLFGKLPAVGDFVQRGLLPAQRDAWDSRCAAAMDDAGCRFGERLASVLEAAPPRGFVLAPTATEPVWQVGCIAPSCDRAGRPFPLVLGVAAPEPWGEAAEIIAGHLVPVLHAAIGTPLPPDRVVDAIVTALAGETSGAIEMMLSWRKDWIALPTALSDDSRTTP